ncbi:MAG: acyltransferase [Rhodobacteraceae bacterium]|nr:acyltransferase [Paracoccaceae bacterium]
MLPLTSAPQRSDTLDWFRGLGILAVLWGHAGLPGLPGAYILIDTFFVISGYLVCQSFLRLCDRSEGEGPRRLARPVGRFLASRVRRIIIPLAATVLLTLAAGWFILLPDDYFALARSAEATLLLQAHLYALTLGNYFDVVGESAPLLHAWSLSLEEWFYLMTPLLVLPMVIWPRKWWVAVIAGLAALSLYRAQTMSADPEMLGASYSLFSTRVWQFMLGMIAALLFRQPPRLSPALNDGLILAGLTGVFASVLILTEKAPSPGLISLPAVVGVLAVLLLQPRALLLARATSIPGITFFGRKLYSLYLCHYPFMVYFTYLGFDLGPGTDLYKFFAAVLVSLGFYYVIEAPFGGWRRIHFAKVVVISAVLIGLTFALTHQIKSTGGAPTRLPDAALAAWTARYDVNPNRQRCTTPQLTRFGYSCVVGASEGPYFALFGDSHSDVFANQLAIQLAASGIGLRHYWYAECPTIGSGLGELGVFSEECGRISHEAHRAVLQDPDLAGVVYALRWPWYLNDATPSNRSAYWRDVSGLPRGYADMARFREDFAAILRTSVADFEQRNLPIYLIAPVPSLPSDPVKAQVLSLWHDQSAAYRRLLGGVTMDSYLQERAAFDRLYADIGSIANVSLIDVSGALCQDITCRAYGEFFSLYYDDNHLNEDGASFVLTGQQER